MKLKELIEKLEERKTIIGNFQGYAVWWKDVKEIFEQLDEPQQVKVPQEIADEIEYHKKKDGYGLFCAMDHCYDKQKDWFNSNEETFALAWIFGYEVEEEKKYKITLLNRNDGDLYLVNQNANLADKYGHFSPVVLLFTKSTNFSEKCYKLTKKEVVLYGFGWVFDCPGIEIEEVEG